MHIEKGIYGLKQSGIIANQELIKHMAAFGYHPVQENTFRWVYDSRKTLFSLVVHNFCDQYCSTEDANHFLQSIRAKYLIKVDMAATVYTGIKIEMGYVHRTVILSMRSYEGKALHIFQNILRGGKEYSPHTCAPIQYGQKVRYADPLDAAEYISDKETNLVQQVCGTLLYYAISINNTILSALSEIYSEQYKATKNTVK